MSLTSIAPMAEEQRKSASLRMKVYHLSILTSIFCDFAANFTVDSPTLQWLRDKCKSFENFSSSIYTCNLEKSS